MASPNDYPNGLNLAGTVFANGPATLQLGGRVYLSGLVQWVDTIDGDNANAGNKPELPVATLAQAVTNSAANGVIVIGAGSSESLGAAQTLNLAGLSIFGCGTGSSRPRYTVTGGTIELFDVTGAGTWIEGIYFPASTGTATARIDLGAINCTVRDCYFECGPSDATYSLNMNTGSSGSRVSGCSFVSVAERPAIGLSVSGIITDAVIEDCTFDGGSYGWSDYALKVTAAATRVRALNNTFTNLSDYAHSVTATTYQIYGLEVGGTGNVLLTA